ncbi:PTS sugar transporter subunit IIA [Acetobacterium woodii]|uniref:Galactitol-specific phosphotransferase enzyme IIA component n=1 Tax=Acetobacterium woodii (strain ATCC 29683 / DSM 1030 / JCM 2381 / KCTC 1655 / WB1) TaxID=931626 RepID=H6LEA7_ACEWD|nr:PTS sugar transporter subunit IIA [Acetobacterium woodii]AFA46821.1 galactitol-specific phosphotransferase enzyme IIA component [Acetobacterium woodii DSM 1030]
MGSLIHIDCIQVNCLVKDQFEAITVAVNPLLAQGYITEDFLDAAIERERVFPTGLPTKIGVALPHTEAKYVLVESISIVTLKNTVVFAGMGNPKESVPVQILFLLAINDPEKQLKVLQTIITIIQNEKVLQKIKDAKEPQTIYNLIKTFL